MSGYIDVAVIYTEEWQRTTTTKVDEADFREWAGTPDGDIDLRKLRSYLEAETDPSWHPGDSPGMGLGDEFITLTVESCKLAVSS